LQNSATGCCYLSQTKAKSKNDDDDDDDDDAVHKLCSQRYKVQTVKLMLYK